MSMADEIVRGIICAGCLMPFTKANGFPAVCPRCKRAGYEEQPSVYPVARPPKDARH